jgi:D-threo-aldose 1-dehydrogenase
VIALPDLGLGCSGLGNLYREASEAEARDTVLAALQAGIGYFDVAPFYGFGMAERRLGDALSEAGATPIVSTKVGRLLDPVPHAARERDGFVNADPFEPRFDYSGDAILRSHEESLGRLRRDHIDILLAHDLGAMTHGAVADEHLRIFLDSGYAAMRRLRDEGAVGAIGIGVNEVAICETLLDQVELDLILLAGRYTLLEQHGALRLLDRCQAAGVTVMIGGPYNSGILAEGSAGAERSHFDYAPPPPEVVARVARLERTCTLAGVALPAAALQFPLRHPAVSTVIAGMIGRAQVEQAIANCGAVVPAPCWEALAADIQETVR